MHAGQPHAQGLYFVLGSATGTSPGIPADNGLTIPLNLDNYYVFTALYPNTSVLTNSLGFLDAQGKGQASFNIPPGLSPTLAGVTLNHAYVVLDFLSNPPQTVFASNSVPVTFVP